MTVEDEQGVVVAGTTGEGATLTLRERLRVAEIAVEAGAGALDVWVGLGGSGTDAVAAQAQAMRGAGVTGLLVPAPYYNRPPQRGLILHFRAIADAAPAPLILYNVPSRTASDLLPESVADLARHPNIVGIKEASGRLRRIERLIRHVPEDFSVLSGDDATTWHAIELGARGVISVVSNEVPGLMAALVDSALAGDTGAARRSHFALLNLMDANFLETNPLPVKAALALMGLIRNVLRSPLTPATPATLETLRACLSDLDISMPAEAHVAVAGHTGDRT